MLENDWGFIGAMETGGVFGNQSNIWDKAVLQK